MCAAAAGADFGIVYDLDDLRGAKFLDSTFPGKGKMIRVKPLDGTEETRSAIFLLIVLSLNRGVFIMVLGEFITNGFHSHIHG